MTLQQISTLFLLHNYVKRLSRESVSGGARSMLQKKKHVSVGSSNKKIDEQACKRFRASRFKFEYRAAAVLLSSGEA